MLALWYFLLGYTRPDQGRHEGGQGSTIPRAPSNYGGPNLCGGRRKAPTMSQALSSTQYFCFRKTSVSNMGVPNLLLAWVPCNVVTPLVPTVIYVSQVFLPGYVCPTFFRVRICKLRCCFFSSFIVFNLALVQLAKFLKSK